MNMNFFNPRKSLRTFQSGGSMPQREQFNSEEEFQAAMEVYLNSMGTPSVASSFVGPIDTTPIPAPVVAKQIQAIPGYQGASVVDFLKSMGVNSSKANRKKLAALSGDNDYDMSGSDNQALMDYVRKNAQGNDKIRNSDGNIVALDGSGQVPLTIDGLKELNRTGSLSTTKQKSVKNSDDAIYAADATKRLAMYNDVNSGKSINFLNKSLSFGDTSPYETIPNYDRTNKDDLGFFEGLNTGTLDQIDFTALRNIDQAIKNNKGQVITSNGRKMDYSRLSTEDKEKLRKEVASYRKSGFKY